MNWQHCEKLLETILVQQNQVGIERTEEILLSVLDETAQFHGRRVRLRGHARILYRNWMLYRRLRVDLCDIKNGPDPIRADEFFRRLSQKMEEWTGEERQNGR